MFIWPNFVHWLGWLEERIIALGKSNTKNLDFDRNIEHDLIVFVSILPAIKRIAIQFFRILFIM